MIAQIKLWFQKAVPNPTDKNLSVQIGCHFEEVSEMMEALGMDKMETTFVNTIADEFKSVKYEPELKINRQEVLDALADQIVTAVGIAHMLNMDIVGACEEVNRSNWSKFVNGEPVFKENGKIAKGPAYTEPDLSKFI